MGTNLTRKLLLAHLVSGEMITGHEIGIRIDQTLTQDATGTLAYLQFEALGLSRVQTELSVSYVDHNTLQTGFENADDHRFLQSAAAKFGAKFSRPSNGICHQVHLESFGVPGKTLLGSDSHTPTGGGLGMLAVGAGGLDVAVVMAGRPFYLIMPAVTGVRLTDRLPAWVSAKDVILELLHRLGVKGGLGKIFEYHGPGVASLTVPERATITNMGAELGATTSIFPSDEQTLRFLAAQGREANWSEQAADPDATYDKQIEINLSELVPLVAKPSSPGNVVPVTEVAGTPVQQVCIGSCTNSSYLDLMQVAAILDGHTVHPQVSLTLSPGSRQVYQAIAENGALAQFIRAGARLLEAACGPCIGMGQSPATGTVSLRTFNRNFPGRSGTPGDRVYLASPLVAAVAALTGEITDPRAWGDYPTAQLPDRFPIDDAVILEPSSDGSAVEIVRGPNIAPLPWFDALPARLSGPVLLKVSDDITTDDIMPAGARVLPLRSNIPAIAEHVYEPVDPTLPSRALEARQQFGAGFLVGGENYGQGSSREHAALAPRYLGIRAVIAKSFARIHYGNLVNFGIVPLIFLDPADYDALRHGDLLALPHIAAEIRSAETVTLVNRTRNITLIVRHTLTPRQREIVAAGGLLNHTRDNIRFS